MAVQVRRRLQAILDHGVEHGLIAGNPIPAARQGKKSDRLHLPAVLDRKELGEILRRAERIDTSSGVKRAHQLLIFCVQRVGEVVGAKWSEFDLKHGIWSIPRERMKRRDPERGPHVVPLPPQLLACVREWRRLDGNDATYVCPAPRDGDRNITRKAVEKFYRRTLDLANTHSPYSWRSVFSTMAQDAGKLSDAIEAQLDHIVGNKVQAAYDRALRVKRRGELMAWYENALLTIRDGADLLEIGSKRNRRS